MPSEPAYFWTGVLIAAWPVLVFGAVAVIAVVLSVRHLRASKRHAAGGGNS